MTDLQKLFKLLEEGFRIIQIQFSFDKNRSPQQIVEMELKRGDERTTLSSSDDELISYAVHLHSIPHFEDDDSDFVYVKNTGKYFALQEIIVSLFTGKEEEFVICERNLGQNLPELIKKQ